jgi:DNA (cytosine-5)-methyltransferase 1
LIRAKFFLVNVVDLFAGVGGFSLGAHQAGFTVPIAIDIDPNLTSTRSQNFPKSTVLHADISSVDPFALLRTAKLKAGQVTGIVGGPPCQGFSTIGARDPKDKRNALILEFFRIVNALKPAFFVLENVPGILTGPFRKILDRGIDSLGPSYRMIGPVSVDAAGFGAATRRVRVLVIGYQSERVNALSADDIRAACSSKDSTVFEAIHDLPGPEFAAQDETGRYFAPYDRLPASGKNGDYARRARLAPAEDLGTEELRRNFAAGRITGFNPTAHTRKVQRRFSKLDQGKRDSISKCPRLSWNEPGPTLRAGTGADRGSYQSIRPIHPDQDRVITIREAARLQGFPDWFQFHATQWHSFRMIGNSISPPVAEAVLRLLRRRLDVIP